MSLLNPTPGVIIDRIGILSLKISAYASSKKNAEQLHVELDELLYHFRSFPRASGDVIEDQKSLNRLNKVLWECEDRVRSLPATRVLDLARLAKQIPKLNDQRNLLIRQIDDAYGCSEPTEEKIYNG
jgi:hypothetical protein